MKKFVLALAAISMIATPTMAQSRDTRWGVDSNQQSPYYGQTRGNHDYDRGQHRSRNRVSTGDAVAIGLGALILGAAIANSNRKEPATPVYEEYQYRTYVPRTVCQTEYVYNRYGEIITDEYGNYIRRRVCWTQ